MLGVLVVAPLPVDVVSAVEPLLRAAEACADKALCCCAMLRRAFACAVVTWLVGRINSVIEINTTGMAPPWLRPVCMGLPICGELVGIGLLNGVLLFWLQGVWMPYEP